MEKAPLPGKQETNIAVNSNRMRELAGAQWNGLMAVFIKDSGSREFNMVLG